MGRFRSCYAGSTLAAVVTSCRSGRVRPSLLRSTPKISSSPALPVAVNRSARDVALPGEPAERETAAPNLRAHQAGDVVAALAPIETGPAKDAFAARAELRAEPGQEARAGVRHLAAVLAQDDVAVGDERVRDRDADLAGQMVVTGAREAQRIVRTERG